MPSPEFSSRRLLKLPSFVCFYFSRLFAVSGYQVLCVAMGWQLYDLTGSALDLGWLGLVQFLPRIVFALPAGVAADKLNRRRLVASMQCLQGLAALALLWGTAVQPEHARSFIFGVSLWVGIARTFEFPAGQAMLPCVVPRQVLLPAIAMATSAVQLATIVAPAIGGFLFAHDTATVYMLIGLSYLLASILVLCLKLTTENLPPALHTDSKWASLLAGIRFIKSRQAICGVISLDMFAVLLGGSTALLPIYAKDILHTGPWGLGLLRAAPAVGALLMCFIVTRFPIRRRVGKGILSAVAVYGLATLVFGISRWLPLSLLALLALGAADMINTIIRGAFIQLATPENMRGRVNAVTSVFTGASNQLGEFESGLAAALLGPVWAVVTGGLGTLIVVALWTRWFPALVAQDEMPTGRPASG